MNPWSLVAGYNRSWLVKDKRKPVNRKRILTHKQPDLDALVSAGLAEEPLSPCFGEKIVGQEYQHRPGAYGIIFDSDQRIAVMETPKGYYLPGGAIDRGETPEQALERE